LVDNEGDVLRKFEGNTATVMKKFCPKRGRMKGQSFSLAQLVRHCGYKDEDAARNCIKYLRSVFENARLPLKVENTGTKTFRIVMILK